MKPLLDDKFAPITSEVGFIKCPLEVAVDKFVDWQSQIQVKRGVALEKQTISGNLQEGLNALLPLTSTERRRFLFVPTKSNWTAYFDNGWRGGDPASTISFLCEYIGCEGLRTVYVPHSLDSDEGRKSGRYGAVIWELYGAKRGDFLNTVRSVFAAYNGGKWEFQATGTPQKFEEVDRYRARRVQDRFTPEMLNNYLHSLGIDAFSENFYCPDNKTVLIEKKGPSAENMREYSLTEARASYG